MVSPKKLFLIDTLGAVLSTLSLGLILPYYQSFFGMPHHALYVLAFIAGAFGIYSFICLIKVTKNWRVYLIIIASANLVYCLFTLGLLFYYFEPLTFFGLTYFVLEALVIIGLVTFEFKQIFEVNE